MPGTAALYPVALSVHGRPCLVVGGGRTAVRKVRGLVRSGAEVTVVAPEVDGQIDEMAATGGPGTVTVARRPYRPGEAAAFRLVHTATGVAEVDRAVADDADAAGVWVNSADDADHCTFLLPAVHRDGTVTVAVSTGGASPALAGWLRDRVGELLGDEAGLLAELLGEVRRELHAAGRSTEATDWSSILAGPVVPLVRSGRVGEARAALGAAVLAGAARTP